MRCCILLTVYSQGRSEKNALYLAQYINKLRLLAEVIPFAFKPLKSLLSHAHIIAVSDIYICDCHTHAHKHAYI